SGVPSAAEGGRKRAALSAGGARDRAAFAAGQGGPVGHAPARMAGKTRREASRFRRALQIRKAGKRRVPLSRARRRRSSRAGNGSRRTLIPQAAVLESVQKVDRKSDHGP